MKGRERGGLAGKGKWKGKKEDGREIKKGKEETILTSFSSDTSCI